MLRAHSRIAQIEIYEIAGKCSVIASNLIQLFVEIKLTIQFHIHMLDLTFAAIRKARWGENREWNRKKVTWRIIEGGWNEFWGNSTVQIPRNMNTTSQNTAENIKLGKFPFANSSGFHKTLTNKNFTDAISGLRFVSMGRGRV